MVVNAFKRKLHLWKRNTEHKILTYYLLLKETEANKKLVIKHFLVFFVF